MKRTLTYLFAVALLAIGNYGVANADTYKKYHIDQNFDGLDALPTGWTAETTNANGTKAVFGRSGSVALDAGGFIKITCGANSGGTRGGELTFPATSSSTTITGHTTFIVEMDWTVNTAEVTPKNAVGLIFLGSHISGMKKDDTAGADGYADAIFGLYATGSGDVLHYWNMDLTGPTDESTGAPYGPVFYDFGSFRRAGADAENCDAINATTATTVPFAKGNTYHIYAELDFANQKVVALTITNKDTEYTQTITNKPFISDKVGVDEDGNAYHYPNDLAQVSTVNSRGNNTGTNGNTVNLEVYYDNLQVYVNEVSLGRTDVTIKRVDQNGATIDTRTAKEQEISTEYFALASDKASFINNGQYYAYDEYTTLLSGGSESVIVAVGAQIVLKFKKTPVTAGLYTWTGETSFYWDEVDNNFSVNGASAIGFQNGNAVAFSNAAAQNKLITLQKPLSLGEGDLTITADGYELSGEGKLTGTGAVVINPGSTGTATIGILNQLEKGITVSSGAAHIKSATAGNQVKVANNAKLLLEAGANYSTPINGEGGAITIETLSNNQYNTPVINVSTVNLVLGVTGKLSSDYSSKWIGAFDENAQVNVTQNIDTIARFAVNNTNVQNVKVRLGDNVSLVRHYNEVAAGTDTLFVGELNGTAGSIIEGGFIAGRAVTYAFGGLNTNAVFAGTIKKYRHNIDSINNSDLMLLKIGTGTWTLSGNSPEYDGSLIEVREGTLQIGGTLGLVSNTTIVNVREGATLKGAGGQLGANLTYIYNGATLAGDLTIENTLYLEPETTVKLHVTDFTNYDVITVTGDVVFDGDAILDIKVDNATAGAKAKLFELNDLSVLEYAFAQILVNGENITNNTATTPGAKYAWLPATGELLSLEDFTGITTIENAKEVQSIKYYNLTGIQVTKNTEGIVIAKTIYTDGSSKAVKIFNPYNRK
jgi:autotransporter-associated beta strand protein